MSVIYDLIIIGAGPAGLTAALYAGRFRLKTLVLEKMSVGGQIILSQSIENFPGFPGGLSTDELISRIKKQVDELGVDFVSEEVLGISGKDEFCVKTSESQYQAKTIILACGAHSKSLDVAGEDRLIGRGVSYCATCDGPLYKNKNVLVVGGGDKAIEEAIFLAEYASSVKLVHRRQLFRASAILVEKVKANPKISFVLDSVVKEIAGDKKVESVELMNVNTKATNRVTCDGVFIFVGIEPNTQFARNLLHLDDSGFIITAHDGATSQAGIFACGDCIHKSLYQVINACGEGAVAVDSAHKYLLNR